MVVMARHGGGAFSGKDPSKVDRSAAYAARYVAKNIVAAGLAERCELQLSYAIGVKQPTSIYVDSNGHNRSIERFIRDASRLHGFDSARHSPASWHECANLCANRSLWAFWSFRY